MHTSPYFTVFVNIPLNVIAFEIVILFRTLPYNTPCRGNDCPVSALAVSKLIQDNQFPLPNQFNKLIISHRLLNCPPNQVSQLRLHNSWAAAKSHSQTRQGRPVYHDMVHVSVRKGSLNNPSRLHGTLGPDKVRRPTCANHNSKYVMRAVSAMWGNRSVGWTRGFRNEKMESTGFSPTEVRKGYGNYQVMGNAVITTSSSTHLLPAWVSVAPWPELGHQVLDSPTIILQLTSPASSPNKRDHALHNLSSGVRPNSSVRACVGVCVCV